MTDSSAALLISGYYGFGNFGDEAILRVFVDEWRRRRPCDSMSVLSADPPATRRAYGVNAVARSAWPAVLAAVRSADLVLSGGGGLLQDATSVRSLLYYTAVLKAAQRAGRTNVIFAQGIGPLGFVGRAIVRRACAKVTLACVRDEQSARLLRDILPALDVSVVADPVFLASIAPSAQDAATLEREGLKGVDGPLIAVVVRPALALTKAAPKLAACIDHLTRRYGAHVVLVPFQRPEDVEAAIEVIRLCRSAPVLLGGGYDLPLMAALFARCSAVIAMRLHALILAAKLAIPFVAVSYDPKVDALLSRLRYPLGGLGADSDGPQLADALWNRRAALRECLERSASELERSAADAFDMLQRLVEGTVG